MKVNYHTHVYYCGHAEGNPSDYAEEAVKKGFKILGISDHAPNDLVHDYHVRMKEHQFEAYLKEIEIAQKKYEGKLKIYKGLEVEYFEDHEIYYDVMQKYTDYLIHGQHYIVFDNNLGNLISGFALNRVDEIMQYKKMMIQAIKSKRFQIHAHPDLYMCGYEKWDEHAQHVAEEICKVAKEEDAIFEYNANGYRRGLIDTPVGKQPRYPRKEFWEVVKKYNIKTILGSDCHKPKYLYDTLIQEVEEEYKNFNFNTVEELDL